MVGGGRPLVPESLCQTDPVPAKTPMFNRYSLVAPQLQHLAKKSSIITNRKSTRRFPMSLRCTAYIAPEPPQRAQKRKMAVFRQKVHFSLLQSFFV